MKLLKVAKITKYHGLKGELFVKPFNLKSQWPAITKIFIGKKDFQTEQTLIENTHQSINSYEVESYKPHKDGFIFKIKGLDDIGDEKLKGCLVFLEQSLFESSKGEFIYLSELLDFKVFVNGASLGSVTAFESSDFQDYLIVKKENDKLSIPFVKNYILEINFLDKKIILDLPNDFPGV